MEQVVSCRNLKTNVQFKSPYDKKAFLVLENLEKNLETKLIKNFAKPLT